MKMYVNKLVLQTSDMGLLNYHEPFYLFTCEGFGQAFSVLD